MKVISVPLPDELAERLRLAAYRDLRLPRMQARYLLEQALVTPVPVARQSTVEPTAETAR